MEGKRQRRPRRDSEYVYDGDNDAVHGEGRAGGDVSTAAAVEAADASTRPRRAAAKPQPRFSKLPKRNAQRSSALLRSTGRDNSDEEEGSDVEAALAAVEAREDDEDDPEGDRIGSGAQAGPGPGSGR